jgi:acetyltransferase-like isoleucine patch superfamily enzyme
MSGVLRARLRTMVEEIVDARLAAALPAAEQRAVRRAYERGRAAALTEPLVWGPADRIHISPSAIVNDALLNTESGSITIGADAFFGHRVSVVTGTHDVRARGAARQRAVPNDGHDVHVEEGAWIGSGAILIGPCRIGAHAVVAAGAVVTGDVAPATMVAGVPARQVRLLQDGDQ